MLGLWKEGAWFQISLSPMDDQLSVSSTTHVHLCPSGAEGQGRGSVMHENFNLPRCFTAIDVQHVSDERKGVRSLHPFMLARFSLSLSRVGSSGRDNTRREEDCDCQLPTGKFRYVT